MFENVIKTSIFILTLGLFILKIGDDYQNEIQRENIQSEEETISMYMEEVDEKVIENKKEIEKKEPISYEMILSIPKINLKKGILKKSNRNNNIDKNVTILEASTYPNEKGNVYIAAHSGVGRHSYFNDLVKLENGDEAYLYYQNNKYVYRVKEIKKIPKDDHLSLVTTDEKNLILITCSQEDRGMYLVIILNEKTD